jgi:TolB protein
MRRASTVLCVLAVALLLPTSAGASPPSTNGLIAFRSDRGGAPQVFAMGADGGNVAQVVGQPSAADLGPAWSPDGRHLAFMRIVRQGGRPDLYVVNANGSARVRLTRTIVAERDPAWSPDGTLIAFAARTSIRGPFRIYVARADGTEVEQLTTQAAGTDRAPAWSPDGTQIAYTSTRNGGFPELYLMNADGSGQRRMTTNDEIDGNPSWSPDGTRIAIERCCSSGTSEIFAIDLATSLEINLTATSSAHEFDPAWAPDGTKVAYVAVPVGGGNVDVWAMNADGTGQTQLTTHAAPDLSPSWQPVPICTISGTDGPDQLVGTDGDDVICGLDGQDTISSGLGNDVVFGGPAGDTIQDQGGSDLLYGESGSDVLLGGPGYDGLDGGPGPDACTPGSDGAFTRQCEDPVSAG